MIINEARPHLGPHEIEIDIPLYGVMLVPANGARPLMTMKIFSDKEKAMARAKEFDSRAYVVRLNGTNT